MASGLTEADKSAGINAGDISAGAVRVVLGSKAMAADRCAELVVGSTVELDSFVDDYVEVHVAGRLAARGRGCVVDGALAVCVQEVLAGSATDQMLMRIGAE